MVHSYNPSTSEAEAVRPRKVNANLAHSETPLSKEKKKRSMIQILEKLRLETWRPAFIQYISRSKRIARTHFRQPERKH